MQVKTVKYTFKGMNRDVANSKHPLEFLYEANNIRFLTTDKIITGGISFEKGNSLKVTIPNLVISSAQSKITYGTKTLNFTSGGELDSMPASSTNQVIIGYAVTRDSVLLFTTDNVGVDCLWEITNDD